MQTTMDAEFLDDMANCCDISDAESQFIHVQGVHVYFRAIPEEYRPVVLTVQTECSKFHTEKTERLLHDLTM